MSYNIQLKYARTINCIREENREIRSNAINELVKLFKTCDYSEKNLEYVKEIKSFFYENVMSNILYAIDDKISQIRMKVIELIQFVVGNPAFEFNQSQLSIVVPALYNRLNHANTSFTEPLEENRVQTLIVLAEIVRKNLNLINPFVNDMLQIMGRLAQDQNPVMLETQADFIINLVKQSKSCSQVANQISMSSKNLILSLSKNLGNQRNKIRKVTIAAISTLIELNPSCFSDVHTHYKKLLSDKNQEVRQAAFQGLVDLFFSFNITYLNKYESTVVLYIMIGLSDENEKIRSFCFAQLDEAGKHREELNKAIESEECPNQLESVLKDPIELKHIPFELKTSNEFNLSKFPKSLDVKLGLQEGLMDIDLK